MRKKTTLSLLINFSFFLGVFLFTVCKSSAQTISPNNLDVVNICAGDIIGGTPFNEYYVSFIYNNFPADVVFDVELTDENGVFLTSPILATKLETTNQSATQQTIKFAIPVGIKGSDNYSLRIKSNKTVNSQRLKNFLGVTSFSIYYKDYVKAFSINNQIATATICSGGSFTLSVDNPTPATTNSSPANYPNIKYKWYKDDVVIAGQSGKELTINSAGNYYAELDYGQCSDVNFASNRVTVTSSSGSGSVTIDSSLGNPFCSNGSNTILTATSGNSYIWRKDGDIISGVTSRTYSTNESGVYTVDVDFGGCKASGSIDLKSNSFVSSLNVPETNDINTDAQETLNVVVTTDAVNPTYQWYRGSSVISGANSNTYLVERQGTYKVKITQASGCVIEQELPFTVTCSLCPAQTSVVIPNFISPNGDNNNDSWILPVEYTVDDPESKSTEIIIISSSGDIKTYSGNYSNLAPWPDGDSKATSALNFKNVNPVYYYVIKRDGEEKKGSITVLK
ncbi:MAG: gliding motility protein SprC [Flavobacterium sp.]